MIRTELSGMLGIKHPIIQAGMGPYSTNLLAAAAANAGALGIISSIGMAAGIPQIQEFFGKGTPYEIMKGTIHRVKEDTRESKGIFGVNIPVAAEFVSSAKLLLQAAVDAREEDPEVRERLRVIITSAGDPVPWAETIKPSGVKWFHVVPSVRHAKRGEQAGVDIIIASGHEGGGHIAWEPVHSMVLLPAVVNAVSTPVVGAGGFCDGATLVAALALGAVGIQMGTRFIATQESDFLQMWKDDILRAGERDTLVARGLFGPMRFLKSETSMKIAEATIEKLPRMFLGEPVGLVDEVTNLELQGFADLFTGAGRKAVMLSGQVAGRINDLPTVKELVEGIVREAEEIILKLPQKTRR